MQDDSQARPSGEELYASVMDELLALADPAVIASLSRFGSQAGKPLGIRMPELRRIARGKRSHALAQKLWDSGYHEARILASMVDDVAAVTPEQMESWVADFDSWDVCDAVCGNLFDRTPYAVEMALRWAERGEEYVRRAGFAMMAWMAVHDKRSGDEKFLAFLPVIALHANDPRNFVRKAVNWALRSIGKRNPALRTAAIETAKQIYTAGSSTGRWVASDALRELNRR
jgi:3-methyladenine DNA glycosylase AlkD